MRLAETIDAAVLHAICNTISNKTDCAVEIMADEGEIIASSEPGRIGMRHPGAARILNNEVDFFDVSAEMARASEIMREGQSLPIELHGKRIASICIAAPLQDSKKYSAIAQTCVTIMLESEFGHREAQAQLSQQVEKHRRTEAALRQSEANLKEMGAMASIGHWRWDLKTGNVKWSEEVYRIYRLDPNEFIPHIDRILDLSPWPEDRQRGQELIQKAMHSHEKGAFEQRSLRPDGSTGYYFSTFQAVYDASGDPIEIQGTVQDITPRKQVQQALELSESRFRDFANTAADWFWEMGPDLRFTYLTGRVEEVMGLKPEAVIGKEWGEIYPEGLYPDSTPWQEYNKRIAERQRFSSFELGWRRPDGEERYISLSARPMYDQHKVFLGYRGVGRDITKRNQDAAQIRESRQMLNDVLNTIPARVFWKDGGGVYLGCNRLFAIDAGKSQPNEVVGKDDYQLWPDQADIYRADDQQVAGSGRPKINYEEPQTTPDGETIWLNTSKVPLLDETGVVYGVLGTYEDITQRKRQQEEVAQLRNYLANIINSMPSVLIGVDRECRITQWNSEAQQATGITFSEAMGRPLVEAFPRLANELERINDAIRLRRMQADSKRPHQRNGETLFEDLTIYPLITNGVDGAVIRLDDVTEQVRLEEMMIQSEKMLSVGGLAAGMAHEINNPLAAMVQTANVMHNRLTDLNMQANLRAAQSIGISIESVSRFMETRGILRMLKDINNSGKRVAEIVDNMLYFARKSDSAPSSQDLSLLLDKTLALAATDYSLKKQHDFKTIDIVREYADDLPSVPCEGAKIQQVLLNLLRNGAQAMQTGGGRGHRIIIRTRRESKPSMARIEIEDNGPGMDESTRKRVFEPFFTTKPIGVGTGLGLSVSYFIITENHGGELRVESEPGKGTRFIIRLPLDGRGSRL